MEAKNTESKNDKNPFVGEQGKSYLWILSYMETRPLTAYRLQETQNTSSLKSSAGFNALTVGTET